MVGVHAAEPCVARPQRCERPGFLLGELEAIQITLEDERIGGLEPRVELMPRALVHEQVDVLLGADPAMVPTVGAHIERADEPVLDVDVAALVAFLPGVSWNLQLYPFGRARLALLFKPSHSCH